ncbi:hypothetical protein AUQ48_01105 [Kocuria flava]|uniref:Uncharacterized protein n=1 Tax=Kocuria flava TaxID=446860 RepID=A0A2N4SYS6_9MICC|nr:hypothetical protein AUQ48_01105 [Kocuria flava]
MSSSRTGTAATGWVCSRSDGTAVRSSRSARRICPASWKRSAGSLASARAMKASTRGPSRGSTCEGTGAVSRTCWAATSTEVSPTNGARPVSSSKSTHAAEYRSERASTDAPRACSGERYWAVPRTAWAWVSAGAVSSTARAIPKSMTFTWPSGVTITLAGLMSRCTIPARWLYSSASRIPSTRSTASRGETASWCTSSRRVRPGTYSMTM